MGSPEPQPDAMFSALLLCGGASQRFGAEKCLAPFRGEPLAQRLLRQLAGISDDTWISANDPAAYAFLGRPVLPDREQGQGPLAGVAAGLRAARHDWMAVIAGDMPFASMALLSALFAVRDDHQLVVPLRRAKHRSRHPSAETAAEAAADTQSLRYEPLHALYHRDCLGPIEDAIAAGQRKIIHFFPRVRVREFAEQEWARIPGIDALTFANVNTPEDFARLEAAAR